MVDGRKATLRQTGMDICNSYTMACPTVRGDNLRIFAIGLSYEQGDKHSNSILYHLHQYRTCTARYITC